MHRLLWIFLTLWMTFAPSFRVAAQNTDSPGLEVAAPLPGAALQGIVTIQGSAALEGFRAWEISFGYAQDTTGTWFLIAEGDQPIHREELAQWDTNALTDGDYNLRLTVYLEGGRREHFVVNNLRVRNYSPVETLTPTPTPTPTPFTETPQPSLTPTLTQPPSETPFPHTVTPLPTNPAILTQNDLNNSLARGAAGAIAAFLLVGLYASVRRIFRK